MRPSSSLRGILSAIAVVVYVPVLIFAIRTVVRSRDHSQRWLSLPACILCKCKFDDKSILFIRFHAVRLAGSALLIANDFPRWASPAYHLMPILCYALHTCSVWALVACTAYLINTT